MFYPLSTPYEWMDLKYIAKYDIMLGWRWALPSKRLSVCVICKKWLDTYSWEKFKKSFNRKFLIYLKLSSFLLLPFYCALFCTKPTTPNNLNNVCGGGISSFRQRYLISWFFLTRSSWTKITTKIIPTSQSPSWTL